MNAEPQDQDPVTFVQASIGDRFANYIFDLVGFFVILRIILHTVIIVFVDGGPVMAVLLVLGTQLSYYILFEYFLGKTPGKFITKTKVVDEYGQKPTLETIVFRNLARFIPLNLYSIFFSGRPWHDSLSGTFVVLSSTTSYPLPMQMNHSKPKNYSYIILTFIFYVGLFFFYSRRDKIDPIKLTGSWGEQFVMANEAGVASQAGIVFFSGDSMAVGTIQREKLYPYYSGKYTFNSTTKSLKGVKDKTNLINFRIRSLRDGYLELYDYNINRRVIYLKRGPFREKELENRSIDREEIIIKAKKQVSK